MLGHNRPPSEFQIGVADAELAVAQDSIAEVRAELASSAAVDTADPIVVERAAGRFAKLAKAVRSWLAWAAGKAGTGVVTGLGAGAGTQLWQDRVELLQTLSSVADTLAVWAQHLLHLL